MAYNSDGYIMIDFTEVDFRRTNQTIEGLFKRCVDIIGTNKFILVINANGRTPLPATCSFTNNQYVIDTVIYMFAVSSNDNLFIRRNDVPASDIIDDSSISVDKTWSSNKIDSELDGKQDTLTAGDNITIDNNIISATGGAQIDDTVIVNNKVWSSLNTVENLAPIDTIVNNPAVFNTSLALPLVECSTSFTATHGGTGTPAPDNECPLVGADDVIITANGVNTVIDLNGTRYGVNINLLTGVMRVINGYAIYNGSENWVYRIESDSARLTIEDMINGRYLPGMCNYFPTVQSLSIFGACFGSGNNVLYINKIASFGCTSIDDFKTWLTTHNIEVVYPLATPIEVQLTPAQISTIIGANSIESNTGNIKVSYRHLPIDLI